LNTRKGPCEKATEGTLNFEEQLKQIDVCGIGPLRANAALFQAVRVMCAHTRARTRTRTRARTHTQAPRHRPINSSCNLEKRKRKKCPDVWGTGIREWWLIVPSEMCFRLFISRLERLFSNSPKGLLLPGSKAIVISSQAGSVAWRGTQNKDK
jgi:hypothetical protein